MTIALAMMGAALVTALFASATTLWNRRSGGPDAQAQMVTASTLLLSQLQGRIEALEARVASLESENADHEANLRAYEALYGPLPQGA